MIQSDFNSKLLQIHKRNKDSNIQIVDGSYLMSHNELDV